MRTMYIILASAGWAWFALIAAVAGVAWFRRRAVPTGGRGFPIEPSSPTVAPAEPEADTRP